MKNNPHEKNQRAAKGGRQKGGRQKGVGHSQLFSVTLGKSKGGLTKGGLSPKFSEKIGGKSFLRNRAFSGQIGTFSGPIGAFSGPIGTNSSAPHSHGGRAEIAPKGPFLAQLAPFGPSPPLLSPPLDFPDFCGTVKKREFSVNLRKPEVQNEVPSFRGGHLKPVTLKPVIRIFRIFRVFVSAFSAFSAFLLCGISSDPCFSGVRGTFRIFRIFPVSVSNR